MMCNHHCDILIVGAGPAGLAAAIALRRRGADVLLADAIRPPIDKPCGEGLLPDALAALAALGVSLDGSGVPFTGITFASSEARVSADFPAGPGLGLRRTTLHALLCERAAELGVRFSWGSSITLRENQPPTLAGQAVAYRWLIGADGASSRVRAWARLDRFGLATQHGSAGVSSRRFGFRAHYRLAPGSPVPTHVEVHWGALGQAYITPTGPAQNAPAEICVSAMTRHPGLRLREILSAIPALQVLLASAEPISAERGCLTLTRRLRRVTRGNIALIGDASGSVDAITGEGLALSFRQALLLADSLSAGRLNLYAARHAALCALPRRMASVLLLLDRHPRLRTHALQTLAAHPALFRSLLAVHTGHQSPSRALFDCAFSRTHESTFDTPNDTWAQNCHRLPASPSWSEPVHLTDLSD